MTMMRDLNMNFINQIKDIVSTSTLSDFFKLVLVVKGIVYMMVVIYPLVPALHMRRS